jgi:hypothetical protein
MSFFTTLKDGQSVIEELPSSLGLATRVTAEKVFMENPTPALRRVIGNFVEGQTSDAPLVPKSELTTKLKDLELELEIPDQGLTQNQFDYLVKIQQDQNRYNAVLARAPDGFLSKAALLGTSFAVAALDPLNIASGFIPFYGEARYSALIANSVGRLGRAAARAKVGFVEGTLGAASLEPLNYGLSYYEQRDYTLGNVLENIMFGGVLGAGLHAGVGSIHDVFMKNKPIQLAEPVEGNGKIISKINPELRNAASRVAIGQVMSGYLPNVESILKLDPNYQILNQQWQTVLHANAGRIDPTQRIEITGRKVIPFDPLSPPVLTIKLTSPAPVIASVENPRSLSSLTLAPSLTGTGEFRSFTSRAQAEKIQSAIFRRSGDVLAIKQTNDGRFVLLREFADKPLRDGNGSIIAFENERAAKKGAKAITSLKDKNITPVPFLDNGKLKFALFENPDANFVAAAKSNPDFVEFELNERNTTQTVPLTEPNAEQIAAIQKAAQEQVQISQMRLADLETVKRADAIYKLVSAMESRAIDLPTAEKEAREYEQMIRSDYANRGMEDDLKELDAMDDLIKDTDNFAKAIESAFNCSVRKGL